MPVPRVVPGVLLPSLLVVALAGCATLPADPYAVAPIAQHLQRDDAVGACARLLREADREVTAARSRDTQDRPVPGFPYLRVDRTAVALRPAVDDAARWPAWRTRLAHADRQARQRELRNAGAAAAPAALDACRDTLLAHDDDPPARGALAAAAQVPDDYSTALRALGLYPLTRLAFAAGIARWQQQTVEAFATPLAQLPLRGGLRLYAPADDPAQVLAASSARWSAAPDMSAPAHDALGLPQPASLPLLLQRHAPLIEVDEAGPFDRIGPLAIAGPGQPARVDPDAAPVVYARVGHAWLGGAWRTQLIYTFWFPQRPSEGPFDLLAGDLDALIWRVTLDDRGHALAYDTIHACGCYHLFFATARVQPRPGRPDGQGQFDEGLFIPQPPLADLGAGERIALRVQSGSHYLQRVSVRAQPPAADDALRRYALRDENDLRSLPVAGQPAVTRSAYDEGGMIPGTQRLERFFFWPMGIASAGQMRQWGRHATAFVGRRHFDDPHLLDRYFTLSAAALP